MRAVHIAVACHYGKKIFSPATCCTDLLHSEERAEDFKKVVRLYIAKTTKKEFIEALSANDTDKLNQIVEQIKDREIARKKGCEKKKSSNKVVSASVHQDVPVEATTEEEVTALAERLKESAAINDFALHTALVTVDEMDLATDEDMEDGTSTEWELI
ncbi:hypothetical protein N0V85_008336 [Neurospora sp. IMI 360204]|nr:hypothetical protein N0V85_008336 [Neurospora sp. IMI 360204]